MKKFGIGCMVLIGLFSLVMIVSIGEITWDQYQDTREWESNGWDQPLSEIPAAFLKNYTSSADQDALKKLDSLSAALTKIEQAGGIPQNQVNAYQELLQQSYALLEQYPLLPEAYVQQMDELALLLELEEILATAYEMPDAAKLAEAEEKLLSWDREHPSSIHDSYKGRFQQVSEDYGRLQEFLADGRNQFGTWAGPSLTINPDLDLEASDTLLDNLRASDLIKFPAIGAFCEQLDGQGWLDLLKHNHTARSYKTWLAAKETLQKTKKSDYVLVGSIATYQDAVNLGFAVEASERPGYQVSMQSPVEWVSLSGTYLQPDQYVKKNAPVLVSVIEEYEPLPTELEENLPPIVGMPGPFEESEESSGDIEPSQESTEPSIEDPEQWEEEW